jgi:hypothetical protein
MAVFDMIERDSTDLCVDIYSQDEYIFNEECIVGRNLLSSFSRFSSDRRALPAGTSSV